MIPYIAAAVVGYLLGCANLALLIGKYKGVDMRANGTGNLGTCNALVLLGWKAAALVCVHDIGKAVLAVLLMRWAFPDAPLIGYVTGTACVLGHIFPFYLKFKGGKGFAAYIGVTLALNWKFAVLLIVSMAVVVLITDYIVVGTVGLVVSYPLFVMIATAQWIPVAILLVATAAILLKHRSNYIHIWNGTERRVSESYDGSGGAA